MSSNYVKFNCHIFDFRFNCLDDNGIESLSSLLTIHKLILNFNYILRIPLLAPSARTTLKVLHLRQNQLETVRGKKKHAKCCFCSRLNYFKTRYRTAVLVARTRHRLQLHCERRGDISVMLLTSSRQTVSRVKSNKLFQGLSSYGSATIVNCSEQEKSK